MSHHTQDSSTLENAGPFSSEELWPQLYARLRTLAAEQLAVERKDHTLQPTALVHEAYVRLLQDADEPMWKHRGHFIAAAAQAMRRILVDHARQRLSLKRGGSRRRLSFDQVTPTDSVSEEDMLDLDEALSRLAVERSDLASLVTLRFFGDLTMQQAADVLGVSLRTAERNWTYAKAWLSQEIADRQQKL